jgi:hypothetical protein
MLFKKPIPNVVRPERKQKLVNVPLNSVVKNVFVRLLTLMICLITNLLEL